MFMQSHTVKLGGADNMRTLTRWEPFRGVSSLQDHVNRLFNDVFERANQESSLTAWAPSVDIYETEHELVVKADLREFGCHQGGLPERCADAQHPEERGSQAKADQGQRRESGDGRVCLRKVILAEHRA